MGGVLSALAMGMLVGLALGLSIRASDHSANLQQNYLLLASDLYVSGAPLADVRERLLSIGFAHPEVAIRGEADHLAQSPDSASQQEADLLRQFDAALLATPKSQTTMTPQLATQSAAGPT